MCWFILQQQCSQESLVWQSERAAETFLNLTVKNRHGNPEQLSFVHSLIIHAITYKYTAHITENIGSVKIVLLTLKGNTLYKFFITLCYICVQMCYTLIVKDTLHHFVTVCPLSSLVMCRNLKGKSGDMLYFFFTVNISQVQTQPTMKWSTNK